MEIIIWVLIGKHLFHYKNQCNFNWFNLIQFKSLCIIPMLLWCIMTEMSNLRNSEKEIRYDYDTPILVLIFVLLILLFSVLLWNFQTKRTVIKLRCSKSFYQRFTFCQIHIIYCPGKSHIIGLLFRSVRKFVIQMKAWCCERFCPKKLFFLTVFNVFNP